MDVGGEHRRHLATLDVAHPPLGVEHEDLDARAARQRVDRRRSGVAAGRSDYRQLIVPAGQETFEQQAEELQRDVLEGEGRAVEQLEQPVVRVELNERGHRGVAEPAVRPLAHRAQLGFGERVADERGHDPDRGLGVGQAAQVRDLIPGQRRPRFGHVQSAVARETGERRRAEIEDRRGAAGAVVAHDRRGTSGRAA